MTNGLAIERWAFPGKVLFVDNKFEEIKDLMNEFTTRGISVQYWDSKSDPTSPLTNVRIIILDLKLDKDQGDEKNEAYFYPAAEALSKITGPYLLIILSTDYEEGDITKLKDAYKDYIKLPIYSIGEIGLEKDLEFSDYFEKIKCEFDKSDIFKMILAWEQLLDLAKDKALGELTKDELKSDIHAFVKSIFEEVEEGSSLSREFVANMTRFVSRYMNSGNEFVELTNHLKKLAQTSVPGSPSNNFLQNLHMYYTPDKSEKIWTGDIFKLPIDTELGEKQHWRYAIILTPACDIAQASKRPIDTLLLCEGFPLDENSICDVNHPFRRLNRKFKISAEIDALPTEERKEKILKKFRESMGDLPQKFYLLMNLREDSNYLGLCFDFQHVRFVDKKEFDEQNKQNRICRLDSPFIEDLLQKYGAYSTRLGVPGGNSL